MGGTHHRVGPPRKCNYKSPITLQSYAICLVTNNSRSTLGISMLSNDQPITRPGDDQYRRKNFALTLARSIRDATYAKNGFVFAITGDWGYGKSSVLRLIERYLLHLDISKRTTIPLWWQEEAAAKDVEEVEKMALLFERIEPRISQLLDSNGYFIRSSFDFQLSECKKILPDNDDAKNALCYWHLKDAVAQDPDVVVVHFAPWIIAGRTELASALLSELARALGDVLGDPVREAFGKLLLRLSELAPIVGSGINMASPGHGTIVIAAGTASAAAAKNLTSGPTLDGIRFQLAEILRRQSRKKVLVIVDDIDRLTPDEAAQTVSLIKSLGDLPNVIYLLSYDRLIVGQQLEEALKVNDGLHYLEKIVQHEVELPPIEDTDLVRAVNANISEIFSDVEVDADRLAELWNDVLKHYIKNPRDARRYFNPVAMAQSGLAEFTDPVDLMGLQAMHVFEPAVYKFIRENLNRLSGEP